MYAFMCTYATGELIYKRARAGDIGERSCFPGVAIVERMSRSDSGTLSASDHPSDTRSSYTDSDPSRRKPSECRPGQAAPAVR